MHQQACKLGSSMASKLASSVRVMHNDYRLQNFNPAAKPFLPQSKNYNLNPSSLSSYTTYAATPSQPHIEYYNQPNFGDYTIPWRAFVHPTTLSQYQVPNFYIPTQQGYCSPPSPMPKVAPLTPDLRAKIVHQIEYYFSDENLKNDPYLISLMDDKGWVPIATIADFNRVKAMCKYLPFIRDSLLGSSIIQVEGHNIRRRNQWSKWLPSPQINEQPKEISAGPKKICTPVVREPGFKNGKEAKGSRVVYKPIKTFVVKSILKRPMMTTTPMNEGTHVEAMQPSPQLNSEHDMVEEEKTKKTLECSSPKSCQKTQSSRSLLDVEFVRAYLAKGDEAFNDDTFSEYRPQTLKKKTKEPECGKGKSSRVGFSGRSPSRTRALSHMGLYLNYTCAKILHRN